METGFPSFPACLHPPSSLLPGELTTRETPADSPDWQAPAVKSKRWGQSSHTSNRQQVDFMGREGARREGAVDTSQPQRLQTPPAHCTRHRRLRLCHLLQMSTGIPVLS